MVHLLFDQGKVENLGKNFWLNRTNLETILHDIREYFSSKDQLTISDFKDITGLSRKTAIPLLEYLDKYKFTQREDNFRLQGDALHD